MILASTTPAFWDTLRTTESHSGVWVHRHVLSGSSGQETFPDPEVVGKGDLILCQAQIYQRIQYTDLSGWILNFNNTDYCQAAHSTPLPWPFWATMSPRFATGGVSNNGCFTPTRSKSRIKMVMENLVRNISWCFTYRLTETFKF